VPEIFSLSSLPKRIFPFFLKSVGASAIISQNVYTDFFAQMPPPLQRIYRISCQSVAPKKKKPAVITILQQRVSFAMGSLPQNGQIQPMCFYAYLTITNYFDNGVVATE